MEADVKIVLGLCAGEVGEGLGVAGEEEVVEVVLSVLLAETVCDKFQIDQSEPEGGCVVSLPVNEVVTPIFVLFDVIVDEVCDEANCELSVELLTTITLRPHLFCTLNLDLVVNFDLLRTLNAGLLRSLNAGLQHSPAELAELQSRGIIIVDAALHGVSDAVLNILELGSSHIESGSKCVEVVGIDCVIGGTQLLADQILQEVLQRYLR